jgi:competence protein ComEA
MFCFSAWRVCAALALWVLSCWVYAGVININTADAETLDKVLVGIGPAKAKAIVAYREANGPFKSVDELDKVKGIGAKTVDRNRDLMTVDAFDADAEFASP